MRANKGEWSELYVLLRLLAYGKLFSAGENTEKLEDVCFQVLNVFRSEGCSFDYEYRTKNEKTVELYLNSDKIASIDRSVLAAYSDRILKGIKNGGSKGAFEIDGSDEVMRLLHTKKIKAPSTDKTDIKMEIHDNRTGYSSVVGYSIKSDLGMPPTLLNASNATNFIYDVIGNISDEDIKRINAIESNKKIMDRMAAIEEIGYLKYRKMANRVFEGNVMLIDSLMDEILGNLLLFSFQTGNLHCADLVTELEFRDPLGYDREGIYRYKFKKFLCAVALGMLPSKVWDGRDEANGGYIIVKTNGDVVAYHLYNRDAFETYLLNNTSFERASTSRYGYAELYKDNDNKLCIDLNLQIRFK